MSFDCYDRPMPQRYYVILGSIHLYSHLVVQYYGIAERSRFYLHTKCCILQAPTNALNQAELRSRSVMAQAFHSPRPISLSMTVVVAAAFCFGIMAGGFLHQGYTSVETNVGPKKGSIQHIEQIPFRKTSHIDEEGNPIVKQQFIEPFIIPSFVGYSVATFKPGQIMMPPHEHNSLHEFFYVIEGTGIIQKDGVDNHVKPGTFLHMAPFEKHGIWVPKDATEDMKMVVCGVTVGEK